MLEKANREKEVKVSPRTNPLNLSGWQQMRAEAGIAKTLIQECIEAGKPKETFDTSRWSIKELRMALNSLTRYNYTEVSKELIEIVTKDLEKRRQHA